MRNRKPFTQREEGSQATPNAASGADMGVPPAGLHELFTGEYAEWTQHAIYAMPHPTLDEARLCPLYKSVSRRNRLKPHFPIIPFP